MDPDRFSTSVCVLMVCLLGTTRLSSVGHCACPEIPRRNFTLQPEAGNCFNVSYRYRYTCIPGYVRKAGTSNLIRCSNLLQWTTTRFPLECIRKRQYYMFLGDRLKHVRMWARVNKVCKCCNFSLKL
uniref:Sushi domain-containing protein n=1 Tax=Poecilia latipinna TaxID=48699 RepID=A0A3B3TR04_9TELE